MREPLIVGTLNDGLEPLYSGTDVPRIAKYAQVLFLQELDRNLSDQLPGWWTRQGDREMGLAIKPGLMDVESSFQVALSPWSTHVIKSAMVARVKYNGTSLTFISAHRPTKDSPNMGAYNQALSSLINTERSLGREVIVGMDANGGGTDSIQSASHTLWYGPNDYSVDGFLITRRVAPVGIPVRLHKEGEHYPVIFTVTIPSP